MTPCVVLDTETTGFPNNGKGFCARIIEVGAVVVTADARVVSPISFFVRQPRAHLDAWQARKAMQVHGIQADTVLREGIEALTAADRFAIWLGRVRDKHGVSEVRAYNQAFDFWFLQRAPWDLFGRTGLIAGEDIQVVAKRAMGSKRRPKLAAAAKHAQDTGCDAQWLSAAHRAQEDARMAAVVAIHFERGQSARSGV